MIFCDNELHKWCWSYLQSLTSHNHVSKTVGKIIVPGKGACRLTYALGWGHRRPGRCLGYGRFWFGHGGRIPLPNFAAPNPISAGRGAPGNTSHVVRRNGRPDADNFVHTVAILNYPPLRPRFPRDGGRRSFSGMARLGNVFDDNGFRRTRERRSSWTALAFSPTNIWRCKISIAPIGVTSFPISSAPKKNIMPLWA